MSHPSSDADAVRVVVYVRHDCHLCEPAREVVRAVCDQLGESWREVDIDHPGAAGDIADLRTRYGDFVPVVLVDGVPQGFWRIEPERLRRVLSGR